MNFLNKLVNLFKKSIKKDSLPDFFNQYNKKTKLIISLSALGLILFLSLVSVAPFRDKLLSSLYPKPQSKAEENQKNQKDKKGNDIKFVSNELLIKVKSSSKDKLKNKFGSTSINALDKISKADREVAVKEIIPEKNKSIKKDSEVFLWRKITLGGKRNIVSNNLQLNKENKENYAVKKLETFKKELRNDPDIEVVEYNYIVSLDQTNAPELSSPCMLTSASWSVATATPGQIVNSNVGGNNCAGATVSFQVRRFGSTPMDDIAADIQPEVITLDSAGQGAGTWTVEYKPQEPGGSAQYYFIAYASGNTLNANSTLTVNPGIAPTSTPLPTPTLTPTPHTTPPPVGLPNDPYYSSTSSWGQPYDDLWGLKKIDIVNSWSKSDGEGVVVAVIDSGLDYNHEDIRDNVWINTQEIVGNNTDDDNNGYVDDVKGWDFITYDGSPDDNDPMDDVGHGTHVAGTIAAVTNNGIGVASVAPKSKIMTLKGLDSGGGAIDDLARAILYAADNGARVINASWGGKVNSVEELPQILADAVSYAHDIKDVVFVAAAGNNNANEVFFPAAFRNVITVASSDRFDQKSDFSNYGAKIDVTAPGGDSLSSDNFYQNILSLKASNINGGNMVVGSNYYRNRGTSMAAPHVAGVAALVSSLHPTWDTEQIRQALRVGGDDVQGPGFDLTSGYGRINAARAVGLTSEPSIAHLTEPNGESFNIDNVIIKGVAYGPNFSGWRLDYGPGDNPSNWSNIASSSSPVTGENILTNWNTENVPDNSYAIRLTVQNTAGVIFEDRTKVALDRLSIANPDPTRVTVLRAGSVVNIIGTAAFPQFQGYTISVNRDGLAIPANITLANGGQQKVRYGLLATWDTTGIPVNRYTICLIPQADIPIPGECADVIIDPTIHTGWPKDLQTTLSGAIGLPIQDHLNTADLNGDGKSELIIGYGDSIHILNDQGNELSGWPQRIDLLQPGSYIQVSPAVGDLDKDGSPEIIAVNYQGDVYAWHINGSLLPGWPIPAIIPPGSPGPPGGNRVAVEDIDGDGSNEIIKVNNINTYVYKPDKTLVTGWPNNVGNYSDYAFTMAFLPAIGDLNHDGKKEIVELSGTNLFVFKSDGALVPGWPKSTDVSFGNFNSNPILIDTDNDQNMEIVIGTTTGYVMVYRYDGSLVSGWPQKTNGSRTYNLVSVGDINGDNLPEIISGDLDGYLYVWQNNGQLLQNWPIRPDNAGPFVGIASTDVDGDNKAEVIVLSGLLMPDSPWKNPVMAYKSDGSVATGFPKIGIGPGTYAINPAIADLDGDGLLEFAWVDWQANAYVWDLPGKAVNTPLSWPMYQQNAQHTGAIPISTSSATLPNRLQIDSFIRIQDKIQL